MGKSSNNIYLPYVSTICRVGLSWGLRDNGITPQITVLSSFLIQIAMLPWWYAQFSDRPTWLDDDNSDSFRWRVSLLDYGSWKKIPPHHLIGLVWNMLDFLTVWIFKNMLEFWMTATRWSVGLWFDVSVSSWIIAMLIAMDSMFPIWCTHYKLRI